jgi:DnaJ family protein C protein 28
MEDGAFDNLSGEGKPLDLSENPHVDPSWQMAYHLLKENGFLPAFIEQRQAIETELAAARAALVRTWGWRQQALEAGEDSLAVDDAWIKARDAFSTKVAELNKRIDSYNLQVPSAQLQRAKIDLDAELKIIE